ncbi:MAG: 6-bladed beta-propeller, partial [Tyzzerella sp.]|nr:6-bladed beta-propeller [Tyzzerella sp.]
MRNLFLFLLFTSLVSCQSKKEVDSSVRNIVLDLNTEQDLRLSEIADTVEVIPLEQTYDSDIAQVERFIPYKEHYYVLNTIGFS